MFRVSIVIAAAAAYAGVAHADARPTDEETAKLKAALTEWGCEGGTIEKEMEGTGVLEVNDAKCKGMQYDLKFDSAYKLISMTRD